MNDEARKIVDAFLSECRALAEAPPDPCIRCGSDDVAFNGTHTRGLSKLVLDVVVYIDDVVQRRLRCRPCRLRWLRRAPQVLPRAHYQACVITSAVAALAAGAATSKVATAHDCDRRTVRRFVERVANAGDPGEVARELAAAVDGPVLPAVPVVERKAPLGPTTAQQLARAISLLVLVEALGSVRGHEPPALFALLRERIAPVVVPRDAQRETRARDPPSAS